MKKPERKKYTRDNCVEDRFYGRGFNQAYNAWEKFLPNISEIKNIVDNYNVRNGIRLPLTKSLAKRIGK